MTDVYLSFSKARSEDAAKIAQELGNRGYLVWRDTSLLPTGSFGVDVDQRLDEAKAVLVIWTPESAASQWVRSEALMADRQDKLINLHTADFSPSRIPIGVGHINSVQIDDIQSIVVALDRLMVPRSRGMPAQEEQDQAPPEQNEATDAAQAISDDQIQPHDDAVVSAPKQARIAFICYRREDSAYAVSAIFEKLESNLGEGKVFKDVDSIPYGASFPQFIQESLQECQYCLVVIGRNWLGTTGADGKPRLQDPNDHVRVEIETAFRQGLTVIPIYVDSALSPTVSQLPESLARLAHLNGVPVRPGADLNVDINRLAKALKG